MPRLHAIHEKVYVTDNDQGTTVNLLARMKVEGQIRKTMEANILCWLVQVKACWVGHYLERCPKPNAHEVQGIVLTGLWQFCVK